MLKILAVMATVLTLTGCDPIYIAELRNQTDSSIEIKVCGRDIYYVNHNYSGKELSFADSTRNCKTIKLDKGKTMPIARASQIAKPITYENLGFEEIEITTKDGQIHVTGQAIMDLFDIEKKTNFIGIHSYDLYYIEIGKKIEK